MRGFVHLIAVFKMLMIKWGDIWFVLTPSQGSKCPKFENPDPVLVPVGFKTRIGFEGMNLQRYQVNGCRMKNQLLSTLPESINLLGLTKTKVSFWTDLLTSIFAFIILYY